MDKTQNNIRLFPNYFKKIAIAIILASVSMILLSYYEFLHFEKEAVNYISKSIILTSLLILALSKDKVEDEFTLIIRLKSLAGTFIYGVITVIIDSFLRLFSEGEFLSNKGVTELLISMFIFYFVMVFFYKKYR